MLIFGIVIAVMSLITLIFYKADKEKAKKLAEILYASSELVAGVDVEDPVGFVNLITELF